VDAHGAESGALYMLNCLVKRISVSTALSQSVQVTVAVFEQSYTQSTIIIISMPRTYPTDHKSAPLL
jgi:hypothetical protein